MTTTTIAIRAATLSDLDTVLAIQAEGYAPETRESRVCLGAILALGKSLIATVADDDDDGRRDVAYLLLHTFEGDEIPELDSIKHVKWRDGLGIWIHDLCVRAGWRRRGIGERLVRFMMSQHSKREMRLISMNPVSHEFWIRLGFITLCKRMEFGYGGRAWLMERI